MIEKISSYVTEVDRVLRSKHFLAGQLLSMNLPGPSKDLANEICSLKILIHLSVVNMDPCPQIICKYFGVLNQVDSTDVEIKNMTGQ